MVARHDLPDVARQLHTLRTRARGAAGGVRGEQLLALLEIDTNNTASFSTSMPPGGRRLSATTDGGSLGLIGTKVV